MRKIVVVPYHPGWPEQYRVEAAKIAAVFGPELVAIHHIGSTSVPGLSAKPIIDMMPVVRDIERVESFNPAMVQLGYEPKGENGIPGRRYFAKGGDANRSHHVHIFALDNPEVNRHLDFRDYLIVHPAEARHYAALKAELAQQFPYDILDYMAGKDGLIKEILQKARAWRDGLEQRFSPDGNFALVLAPYEMRMSHWVNWASLWDVQAQKYTLSIGDELWSADTVTWQTDSTSVTLEMRRYPGDVPGLTVDLEPANQIAHVHSLEGSAAIPFAKLSDWLEKYYRQHQADKK